MANVNVDDVLRVTAEMTTVDLGVVQNVYTVKVPVVGALPIVDVLDRIVVILELLYAIVKGWQNTRSKYTNVKFFNITQSIPLATRPWTTITEGELAGEDLAHMTSAMFSLGVDKPGVSGRKFYGGLSELRLDQDGLWNSTQVAEAAAVSLLMLSDQSSGGTTVQFGILTGVVPAFIQFVTATTRNIPASQRRRRQGVGI